MSEKKIVFVDDDANWSNVLPELGSLLGYDIKSYQSADECLEVLCENPELDLLITDIRMPGKSGYELIRDFREKFPDKAVMIITGYNTNKLKKFIQKNDIKHYLLKPFSVRDFQDEMKSCLDC